MKRKNDNKNLKNNFENFHILIAISGYHSEWGHNKHTHTDEQIYRHTHATHAYTHTTHT